MKLIKKIISIFKKQHFVVKILIGLIFSPITALFFSVKAFRKAIAIFKKQKKSIKIAIVIALLPVIFFFGLVSYSTAIVLTDTVLGTDYSGTVNNAEYKAKQELIKKEKAEQEKRDLELAKQEEERKQKEKEELDAKLAKEAKEEAEAKALKKAEKEQEKLKKQQAKEKVKAEKEKQQKAKKKAKKEAKVRKEAEAKKSLFEKIVLSEGHPVYEGSTEDAQEYLKSIKKRYGNSFKKRIAYPDPYSKYNDSIVLSIDWFGDDTIIRNIEIYPENAGELIDEKKALEIASEYLPESIDIYSYNEGTTYIKYPSVTNKVLEFGTFVVIFDINIDTGYIDAIHIRRDIPKWMLFTEKNGYTTETWNLTK